MQEIKKFIEGAGGSICQELNKYSRQNNNLVNWLKIYDEQIKNYQKEIYDLNLRLYFSSSQQSQSQPQHHPQPQQQQQQQQQQPQRSSTYKSLDDYFRSQK